MKRHIHFFALLLAVALSATVSKAQSTLIHYWHFNNTVNNASVTLPLIVPVDADYSLMDTSKVRIFYIPYAGTSSHYSSYYDFSTGGDVINVRLGQTAGNYLRLRSPNDSMEARFYVPTTGFKNIKFSFETEASSTGAGAKIQYFDYSLDSGATWKTSGMSVLSVTPNLTYPAQDSVEAAWAKVVVSFDSTVNNDGNFIVRMKFGLPNTTGNDRFDNVTVDGDSIGNVVPPPVDTFALIHYWHFNNFSGTYHNPGIPALDADYSSIDTSKARIVYTLAPGVATSYLGYIDFTAAGDLLNAKLSAVAGNSLRVRNPSDSASMNLMVYIPTTHYKDIHLTYEVQSSGGSGQLQQLFDYSVDSGATWKTTGLNMTADSILGTNWFTIGLNFGTDATVNNNPKLVFRIKFAGSTTGGSGNNRFDNLTVEGDTMIIIPPPPPDTFALIHYWHFNNFSGTYHNPGIPNIDADYSAIDTSKAKIVYTLAAGVAANYAGYIDNVAGDTLNAKMNQVAGNGLRVRNPSDSASMSLLFYIPTTGFKDINLKYEVLSSGIGTAPARQLYDYSVDSGATWKTTGLNITSDSILNAVNWGLIAINFGTDTTVNNNRKLVFRVKFAGFTNGATGNNRFDNLTVEGDTIAGVVIPPPPPPADTFALIHYWHFNNFSGTYSNPNIPALAADYSTIDTSKARIVYTLAPGVATTYAGYIDFTAAGDLLNAKMAAVAGNSLRVRNPSDSASMSLVVYTPTTHYKDIHLTYDVQSSGGSGQLQQLFDYSVDSGATWKTAGLNMTADSILGTNWFTIGLNFGTDTTVNNNPKLAFRIKFAGSTTGGTGNNRFDNLTVEGDTMIIVTPPPPPPVDTFALIHYWHFNSFTGTYRNTDTTTIPFIDADYSAIDTSKARIVYALNPGVSNTYPGYIDNVAGDTLNAKMGVGAGNGLRMRNPSDSMSMVYYIPTTGFKNIHLKYEVSTSSTASGQLRENFDYSVDSGATWTTAGLNMTSDSILSTNWFVIALDFGTDTTVNNNAKLVFRIKFAGNTSGSSGNNRFDNVTVEGDTLAGTIIPPPPPADTTVLIHYWHFNSFSGTYRNTDTTTIPAIDADYSILDTSKARIVYSLDAGVSNTYAGYIDNVTGDILNARMNQPAGNGLRVRNPSDSMTLLFYIPTTHYKNIKLKYETETSSLGSGMLEQMFDYSLDSGTTWKTTGLNIKSDTLGITWSLISLNFGSDTLVNNNAKLVFRITFAGNTNMTSGNNRFDNVTVSGDTLTAATDTGNYVTTINGVKNTCTLYPNPATDNIYISTPAAGSKTIAIYSVTGAKVYMAQRSEQIVPVSTKTLASGMYYVLIHDEQTGNNYTVKFVKQ